MKLKFSKIFNDDLWIQLNNYSIYITTTKFELLPLTGTNHLFNYNTERYREYCWYIIWLGLQFEFSKVLN